MDEMCVKLMKDPRMVAFYFALVLGLIILIIMQVWKTGYYRNNSANSKSTIKTERLSSKGTEIPPNYICNTEGSSDVIPNSYVYGTGGISRGAANRHGQVHSDYAGLGREAGYIYTSRLDKNIRDYSNPNNAAFAEAYSGLFSSQ